MDAEMALYVGRRALETALLLSAPVLVVTLLVGFAVAMAQAVTSLRDMTLGLVVKLACVGVTLLVCGGWMMHVAVGFTAEMFNYLRHLGR